MAELRIVVLRAIYFWNACALGVLIRFLVVFLKEIDYTPGQIGILVALRPGVGFFGAVFWGFVGDYTNRRLTVLLLGSLISSLCYTLLLAEVIQRNFWYVFAVIAVACFFGASLSLLDAICLTFLADPSSKQQNSEKDKNESTYEHVSIHQEKSNHDFADKAKTCNDKSEREQSYDQEGRDDDEELKTSNGKNESSRYGETRMWAAIGWGLGAVMCGFLVKLYDKDLIILFYDVCVVLQWVILLCLLPIFIRRNKRNNRPRHEEDGSSDGNKPIPPKKKPSKFLFLFSRKLREDLTSTLISTQPDASGHSKPNVHTNNDTVVPHVQQQRQSSFVPQTTSTATDVQKNSTRKSLSHDITYSKTVELSPMNTYVNPNTSLSRDDTFFSSLSEFDSGAASNDFDMSRKHLLKGTFFFFFSPVLLPPSLPFNIYKIQLVIVVDGFFIFIF
ncbi:major facilitator transporter [Reticulomyxa filosa]|uniref:Major facilitator transporter n=1 Tax=Reticulomyxa filosa TaxID=46433 RepID=X6N4C4_RETFI|nr:major facilitator transporter [Reticulomyxa filosa]|eukprot:ETO20167.1 major facilitator transporter [Reticulomyxa filosa]